jgi:hypothetical protein
MQVLLPLGFHYVNTTNPPIWDFVQLQYDLSSTMLQPTCYNTTYILYNLLKSESVALK